MAAGPRLWRVRHEVGTMANARNASRWQLGLAQAQRFSDEGAFHEAVARARLVEEEAEAAGDRAAAEQAATALRRYAAELEAWRKSVTERGAHAALRDQKWNPSVD